MRDDLLSAGVTGLARAISVGGGWFHGHFGASVLAGHALLNDFDLAPEITEPIQNRLDALLVGAKQFFGAGVDPAPVESLDGPQRILRAIEDATPQLSTSGHGTIYATLGLRAMAIDPTLCTAAHCDGIAELVVAAMQDHPGRYFGTEDYRQVVPTLADVPEFETPSDALAYAISECKEVYPDEQIENKRYFFDGEKIHGVTHAQALCELERLGYPELAQRQLPALRQQLLLNRQVPPGSGPPKVGTDLVPTDVSFWMREPTDPLHLLKLSYAALDAAERLSQPRPDILGALRAVWSLPN